MEVDGAVASAARRRRERRLRSWWKHEQQTVRLALSAAAHHSFDKVAAGDTFNALRGQTRLPPGTRPAPLVEVQPQGALAQHSGIFELVQALDVPVLQMVEQPVDVHSFFRISVPAVAEQVIEVPKLALPSCAVQRATRSEPQLVEQLVEVPTVLSYSLLQQRTAEQTVDTPVPHGRGGGARGGLQARDRAQQRFLELFMSTLLLVVVFTASPRDRAQQRFLELFTSTLLLVEVFTASHRDRAQQRFMELNMLTLLFLRVVLVREIFKVFPVDRVPQRLPVSSPSFLLVEVFKGFPKDRVPQRLPVSRPSFLLVEMRSRCCSGRRRSRGHSSGSMLAGLGHCASPSRRTAGASVFRSHRSASTVTGSSRLNTLQVYMGSKMATSSRLRRCLRRMRRRRKTMTSSGRSLVFLMGSCPCGCVGGSLPGTAGKVGGACSLTL